jgi:hypothetical protein
MSGNPYERDRAPDGLPKRSGTKALPCGMTVESAPRPSAASIERYTTVSEGPAADSGRHVLEEETNSDVVGGQKLQAVLPGKRKEKGGQAVCN